MRLKGNFETEGTAKIGTLPTYNDTLSALVEKNGSVGKRILGTISTQHKEAYIPGISVSFPSIFKLNTASLDHDNTELVVSFNNQLQGTALMAPVAMNGTPAFRRIIKSDLTDASVLFSDDERINNWNTAFEWGDHKGKYLNLGNNKTFTDKSITGDLNDQVDSVVYAQTSSVNKPAGTNATVITLNGLSKYGFQIGARNNRVWYRGLENGVYTNWIEFWHKENLTKLSQLENDLSIPSASDYITTNTNQTGLSGDKTTTGRWTLSTTYPSPLHINRSNGPNNASIRFSTDTNDSVYTGMGDSGVFAIGGSSDLRASQNPWLIVRTDGITVKGGIGGSLLASRDRASISVETVTSGNRSEQVIRHRWEANNLTFTIGGVGGAAAGSMSQWGLSRFLNDNTTNSNDGFFGWVGNNDQLMATSLQGTGTRMVVATSGGYLMTQEIPSLDLSNYYTKPESVSLFVGVNNTQTINGTKTFTNSPIVPNPTLDSHAATKGWVNSFGLGTKIVTSASGNTWDLEAAQDTRFQGAGGHGLSMGGTMWGFRVMSNTTGYGEAFGMKNGRAFMRSLTPSGQTDFLEFWHSGNLENPATEAWVNNQGFIKSVPDKYVTKDNTPSTPLQTTVIDFDNTGNGASILYAGASSTNRPSVSGTAGGLLMRGNHSSVGEYQLYLARGENDALLYRNQSGVWNRAASREWVNSQGFVTTDTKYTAGDGLTLSGTQFSLPVTVSGTGTYVQSVIQNANGITVTLGTPPNTNTTYPAGTKALIDGGTNTTNRVWNSKILKDAILEHGGTVQIWEHIPDGGIKVKNWESIASGLNSISLGVMSSSEGLNGISIGNSSTTKDPDSIAIGSFSSSLKTKSITIGAYSTSNGSEQVTLGIGLINNQKGSVILGSYNIPYPKLETSDILTPESPLLIIGSGKDPMVRSNAYVMNRAGIGVFSNVQKYDSNIDRNLSFKDENDIPDIKWVNDNVSNNSKILDITCNSNEEKLIEEKPGIFINGEVERNAIVGQAGVRSIVNIDGVLNVMFSVKNTDSGLYFKPTIDSYRNRAGCLATDNITDNNVSVVTQGIFKIPMSLIPNVATLESAVVVNKRNIIVLEKINTDVVLKFINQSQYIPSNMSIIGEIFKGGSNNYYILIDNR